MLAMQLHQRILFVMWLWTWPTNGLFSRYSIAAGAGNWLLSPLLFCYFRRYFAFWQIFQKPHYDNATHLKRKCVTTNRPKTVRWNA